MRNAATNFTVAVTNINTVHVGRKTQQSVRRVWVFSVMSVIHYKTLPINRELLLNCVRA